MSIKIVTQFCAICDREKKASNGVHTSLEPTATATVNSIPRHKYGHLPARKNEDFFVQVTEPQWLRRGNLKESDFVCKRHLAVLMRGVDRGCEGGCCSPLHRGARLCKSGNLKTLPPTWRRRFMKHPKIKEEDKDLMLFCWDCYKKHMNRMSKYGDPMGRTFGNKVGLQRTCSLVDSDDATNGIFQAMKRYKSMDKLDTFGTSPTSSAFASRRASSSSTSPRQNGDISFSEKGNDSEVRVSPSRRTNRGRKSHKGKRSPSPPNNISPVRASVVHSKRKHSPHKITKSPSSRRSQTTPTDLSTHSSSALDGSPTYVPRLSIDEGALADTESPRSAPVPPPGLFGIRLDQTSNDVFDVFGDRSPKSTENNNAFTDTDVLTEQAVLSNTTLVPHVSPTIISEEYEPTSEDSVQQRTLETPTTENGLRDDGVIGWVQQDNGVDTHTTENGISTTQVEESTTSADEMADIFSNQSSNDGMTAEWMTNDDNKQVGQAIATQTCIPEFDDVSDELTAYHRHESSGSSSDKTGETQIEREGYTAPKQTEQTESDSPIQVPRAQSHSPEDEALQAHDGSAVLRVDVHANDQAMSRNLTSPNQREDATLERYDLGSEVCAPIKSTEEIQKSVFVSPTRVKECAKTPHAVHTTGAYSLSPQSFRRLQSMTLQFNDDVVDSDDIEGRKLYSDDGVRERSHPMRNRVVMKVPGDISGKQQLTFARLPAEDVEIFPDVTAFLDGITQTVGEGMAMYAQDGVQLVKVDLKLSENRAAHKTSQFADHLLVVRRGQAFEIDLELSEEYEESKHNIIVELMIGESPRVSNNTHLFLPVQRSSSTSTKYRTTPGGEWSTRCVDATNKRVTISLTSPSTCCIASYKLHFQIEEGGVRSRWGCGSEDERGFIVLFNPWNIHDAVFMSSQADRQEYVVSDTGFIYSGNKSNLIPLPWIFGQYEPGVLQACVDLTESSNLSNAKRGDPVAVSKAICQRFAEGVNNRNRWHKRSDEHNPSGADTLIRFVDSGMLYLPGDNKTISALVVTVLRCLGLPSRPVTCLNGAVETDLPTSVNFHYSHGGHSLDYMNDKVWPSYTWTGVWMSRVDLPPGFGGWQAVLSPSGSQKSIGPIPVYGIKKGQTSCCEGTQDHFAALNADKKYWIVSLDGNMKLLRTEGNFTGSKIVTKSVGSVETQDITKLYKFSEGCEEQKLAVHTAYMHCGGQSTYGGSVEVEELSIILSTNPDVINFGNDVDVVTKITNSANSVRHLTVDLHGEILSQEGTTVSKLQKETILAEVLAKETVEIPVKFNLSPGLHKMTHDRHLAFTAFGIVRESESCVVASHLAGIKYPDIEIQVHGEFKVGGEVTVLSRIRNPLSHVLRHAKTELMTSGLTALSIQSQSGKSVGPWQFFKCERVYRCQRPGMHTIVGTFTSDLLNGPIGMQEIEIT